ncbi:MAG TPA: RNA polymerase sigma factor [Acidobacteriota bacterium]|nr:RNA polymerase sigma factor [Acidobacteriota bacterium]
MEYEDDQLVREILRGSDVAFERLMRRYERLVFAVAYGYVGCPEQAMDVVQNVFLKAHGNLGSYRSTGSFKPWLMRIAGNESLNWLRSQKRHRHAQPVREEIAAAPGPGQEGRLMQRQRRQVLINCLERLNPRQRSAVVLRYFEDLPIREIASHLDCSEGVAKNILFRSLQKMRKIAARKEAC